MLAVCTLLRVVLSGSFRVQCVLSRCKVVTFGAVAILSSALPACSCCSMLRSFTFCFFAFPFLALPLLRFSPHCRVLRSVALQVPFVQSLALNRLVVWLYCLRWHCIRRPERLFVLAQCYMVGQVSIWCSIFVLGCFTWNHFHSFGWAKFWGHQFTVQVRLQSLCRRGWYWWAIDLQVLSGVKWLSWVISFLVVVAPLTPLHHFHWHVSIFLHCRYAMEQ